MLFKTCTLDVRVLVSVLKIYLFRIQKNIKKCKSSLKKVCFTKSQCFRNLSISVCFDCNIKYFSQRIFLSSIVSLRKLPYKKTVIFQLIYVWNFFFVYPCNGRIANSSTFFVFVQFPTLVLPRNNTDLLQYPPQLLAFFNSFLRFSYLYFPSFFLIPQYFVYA